MANKRMAITNHIFTFLFENSLVHKIYAIKHNDTPIT